MAFSKEEEMHNKFAMAAPTQTPIVPASNPFSKKRQLEEMTVPSAPVTEKKDVTMRQVPQDIVLMQE
jgi:hypothetical protein